MPALPARILATLAGVAALACQSQALVANDEAWHSRVEFDAIALAESQPAAMRPPLVQRPTADDGLRARWWWGPGKVELGAGADWPTALSTAGASVRTVVGVRTEVMPQTHVVYELAGAARPWQASPFGTSDASGERQARLALEFRGNGSRSYANALPGGLLRVQMSASSALQFRPRGGGLAVSYRALF